MPPSIVTQEVMALWMVTGDKKDGNSRPTQFISRSGQSSSSRQRSKAYRVVVGDGVNGPSDIGMIWDCKLQPKLIVVRGNVTDARIGSEPGPSSQNPVELCIFAALQLSLSQSISTPAGPETTPPTVAAIAMALSSISVVLSSLSPLYRPPNVYR
jgi:hypothetical protein